MGSIVWTPVPGMAKSIVTVRPVTLLESRIAWRSEPGPLSAVVSTTKTPSVITNCVWSGCAPSDWASRVRVVKTWDPAGGVKIMPCERRVERRQRTAVRQRSGPIARAGQAGGARKRQRPAGTESVRLQTGLSGPASGSSIAIPSPDWVAKASDWFGHRADGMRRTPGGSPARRAETSEVLPWGSVAVAVMIGSPAGAVNGTAKLTCPLASVVTSSEPEVVLGLARASGSVAGAGEEIDAKGRVGHAAPQPALDLAVGGRDDDREVLEVVRSLARRRWRCR